jgi:hypothetical protein
MNGTKPSKISEIRHQHMDSHLNWSGTEDYMLCTAKPLFPREPFKLTFETTIHISVLL